MGVRGFTTYMAQNSNLFFEHFNLKNCYIVIDGSGVAIHLYQWHTKSNDCFGGDYDKYAHTVYSFFELLKKCKVTPIILFDGGYENKKLKTVFSRMRNRIGSIRKLNTVTERKLSVFPLFVKELFKDIALELNITCIRNDYESDGEIACLARNLNCPILGYDSDFYFFDTLYIPLTTLELKAVKINEEEFYIPCEVYKVDKFLKHFGGLNKDNLPILPVLLGNDYVKKSFFSAFHRHMKLKKMNAGNDNEQQKLIKIVISWLQHETLESAISKILGRFKSKRRKLISIKLRDAMQGYLQVNSSLTQYLNKIERSFLSKKKETDFDIMKIEPTFEEEIIESESEIVSSSDENESDINDEKLSVSMDVCDLTDLVIEDKSDSFSEKYRRCLLPQCFMDFKVRNTYFCISQVEDYSEPHSHSISEGISINIHKILKKVPSKNLIMIVREKDRIVKKELSSNFVGEVPTFQNIQTMNAEECKRNFLKILNIDEVNIKFLSNFPKEWHLFLLSLYFWKFNSKNSIDYSFLYSVILCAMFLNVVDPRVGFCRSMKKLQKKWKQNEAKNRKMTNNSNTNAISSLENIEYSECIHCSQVFLDYFHMNPKTSSNKKLFDARIVGIFSEFQSCVLHVKYLNELFNFPFSSIMFSKFFNGTFLYNLALNFSKRTNLNAYIETLLRPGCPGFLDSFKNIVTYICDSLGEIYEGSHSKKRRRKKKKKEPIEKEDRQEEVTEDDFVDEENKFSILLNAEIS